MLAVTRVVSSRGSTEGHIREFAPGRDGVKGQLILDEQGSVRGLVCLDTHRTTPYRITISQADSFLRPKEARLLAQAILTAADESEALDV